MNKWQYSIELNRVKLFYKSVHMCAFKNIQLLIKGNSLEQVVLNRTDLFCRIDLCSVYF